RIQVVTDTLNSMGAPLPSPSSFLLLPFPPFLSFSPPLPSFSPLLFLLPSLSSFLFPPFPFPFSPSSSLLPSSPPFFPSFS
ncbi:hypothetical protein ACXWRS_11680, partial [Streptococcus pyogenes]